MVKEFDYTFSGPAFIEANKYRKEGRENQHTNIETDNSEL